MILKFWLIAAIVALLPFAFIGMLVVWVYFSEKGVK